MGEKERASETTTLKKGSTSMELVSIPFLLPGVKLACVRMVRQHTIHSQFPGKEEGEHIATVTDWRSDTGFASATIEPQTSPRRRSPAKSTCSVGGGARHTD